MTVSQMEALLQSVAKNGELRLLAEPLAIVVQEWKTWDEQKYPSELISKITDLVIRLESMERRK